MIQRIQSLYLLVATALMSLTLFTPIATFVVDSGDVFTLTAFNLEGDQESQSALWMGIVLVLATVLPFVTIFLFKNRMLQVRLCAVEIVVLLGCLVFEAIYFWLSGANALDGMGLAHRQFGWAAIMPLLALGLTALAARATFKDEMLVRSLDRIR